MASPMSMSIASGLWMRMKTVSGPRGPKVILSCEEVDGYADNSGDCNDDDAGISPDATEVCDGIDNNGAGEADVDAADAVTLSRPRWRRLRYG